jgi:outer membrane protein OmpA-like peptidoglycan-associated protein
VFNQLAFYLLIKKTLVMAEIDVQPKKKSSGSILPWILGLIAIIAICIFIFRKKDKGDDYANRDKTTYNSASDNAAAAAGWNAIDWNAPAASYDEVTDRNIEVRSKDNYSIYGLGQDVLFDKDAATIRPDAENNLKQIASSINKRYGSGQVAVFGFTDATGSEEHNQQLSEQRATAVKDWFANHGIDNNHISLQARGENNPAATNATEEGKQQNRRVEIVARKD